LVNYGPVYWAGPVYHYGENFWKQRPGDSFQGGHAVSVIGFNKQGFILQNHWSSDWANGGFALWPYEDFDLAWELWSTTDAEGSQPIDKLPFFLSRMLTNFSAVMYSLVPNMSPTTVQILFWTILVSVLTVSGYFVIKNSR